MTFVNREALVGLLTDWVNYQARLDYELSAFEPDEAEENLTGLLAQLGVELTEYEMALVARPIREARETEERAAAWRARKRAEETAT